MLNVIEMFISNKGDSVPKNSSVHKMYVALVREGYPESSAAKISQSKTGLALQTGKPPKGQYKLKRSRNG